MQPGPYRPDLTDRFNLHDPAVLKAFAWALPLSAVLGVITLIVTWPRGPGIAMAAAAGAFCASMLFVGGGSVLLANLAGRAGGSVLLPSGQSTPAPDDFSREKTMLVRGQVQEALMLIRSRLVHDPGNAALALLAGDVYAREAGEPRRAEVFFRRARGSRTVSPGQEMYATNRLIDLYLGPLDNPARAAEELAHLIERHPGTREASNAKQLLLSLTGSAEGGSADGPLPTPPAPSAAAAPAGGEPPEA